MSMCRFKAVAKGVPGTILVIKWYDCTVEQIAVFKQIVWSFHWLVHQVLLLLDKGACHRHLIPATDNYPIILGMIHIWHPWELSIFQDPPPPLSSYVQNSSTSLTMDIRFQTNPLPLPSPNDNQSIKRKHNPRMTIICYQIFTSDQLLFSVSTH